MCCLAALPIHLLSLREALHRPSSGQTFLFCLGLVKRLSRKFIIGAIASLLAPSRGNDA